MSIAEAIKKVAENINFSKPSKMPWLGWSIPAELCKVGAKLVKVAGSTCENCYANKGRYKFSNVADCLTKRLEVYNFNPNEWTDQVIHDIRKKSKRQKPENRFFRWFDSGDLQDRIMLENINSIALNCPDVQFWLPTKERKIVSAFLKVNRQAENLTIRLSDYHKDKKDILPLDLRGLPQAGVISKGVGVSEHDVISDKGDKGEVCPAYLQGGKCGSCRKCWNKAVPYTKYYEH